MQFDLVFEGGGAKGIVFVGALQALESRGHTIGRVIGTSAGAITATLIAAGFDSEEALHATQEKLPNGKPRFSSFMDTPGTFDEQVIQNSLSYQLLSEVDIPYLPDILEKQIDRLIIEGLMQKPAFRHLFAFVERGGWYGGNMFIEWIREKMDSGGRDLSETTLTEFNLRTARDLTVIGSDITGSEMLVLNHRTAPNCPTAWAVRMSMSVPFAWQEVEWDRNWGLYRGRDITGHRVVDGGLLSNFPIGLLVSRGEEVEDVMGEDNRSERVLGLLIDETLPVPEAEEPLDEEAPQPGVLSRIDYRELEIVRRITGMANTVTQAHDKFVRDTHKDFVCRLPAKGYGTLEFDMSDQRMEAAIGGGRMAVEGYLDAHGL